MKISAETLAALRAALGELECESSPVRMNAGARLLEEVARQVREQASAEINGLQLNGEASAV